MESRRFEAEFPVFQENSSFTGVFLFGRNQKGLSGSYQDLEILCFCSNA
jgi:hypothetical protein